MNATDEAGVGHNATEMKRDLLLAAQQIGKIDAEIAELRERKNEIKHEKVKAHGIKLADFNTVARWWKLEGDDRQRDHRQRPSVLRGAGDRRAGGSVPGFPRTAGGSLMSSNRIQLEAIRAMPVGEIAALPTQQLALLQEDAEAALKEAKSLKDWLDGAIGLRFAEKAHAARQAAGKDTGTVRFLDGDFTVVVNMAKSVRWDQTQLAVLVERIRNEGDDPTEYVDIAFKVPERKYAAWPEAIRRSFEPARTVRAGSLTVSIEPNGNAQ